MKKIRILPSAAGIIALTATIGFVDGRHETEAESISRSRITPVMCSAHIAANGDTARSRLNINPAYLVEFKRSDVLVHVLIDAESGRTLAPHSTQAA